MNSMDQSAKSMELASAGVEQEGEPGLPRNAKRVEAAAGDRHMLNHAVRRRMERELRAQGFTPGAIARLLHLGQ